MNNEPFKTMILEKTQASSVHTGSSCLRSGEAGRSSHRSVHVSEYSNGTIGHSETSDSLRRGNPSDAALDLLFALAKEPNWVHQILNGPLD